jgi:hypothetical protein
MPSKKESSIPNITKYAQNSTVADSDGIGLFVNAVSFFAEWYINIELANANRLLPA